VLLPGSLRWQVSLLVAVPPDAGTRALLLPLRALLR